MPSKPRPATKVPVAGAPARARTRRSPAGARNSPRIKERVHIPGERSSPRKRKRRGEGEKRVEPELEGGGGRVELDGNGVELDEDTFKKVRS